MWNKKEKSIKMRELNTDAWHCMFHALIPAKYPFTVDPVAFPKCEVAKAQRMNSSASQCKWSGTFSWLKNLMKQWMEWEYDMAVDNACTCSRAQLSLTNVMLDTLHGGWSPIEELGLVANFVLVYAIWEYVKASGIYIHWGMWQSSVM